MVIDRAACTCTVLGINEELGVLPVALLAHNAKKVHHKQFKDLRIPLGRDVTDVASLRHAGALSPSTPPRTHVHGAQQRPLRSTSV
jgi:hypothetical protein